VACPYISDIPFSERPFHLMILRSWTRPAAGADALLRDGPADALLLADSPHLVALTRLDALPGPSFTEALPDDPQSAQSWRQGHVFTPEGHLQWRRLGQQIRVVTSGEAAGEWVPDTWGEPAAETDLRGADTDERTVVLWGRRRAGEDFWLELRVSQFMTAPVHHPPGHGEEVADEYVRRALQVRTYRDATSQEVLHHRYLDLTYAKTDEDDTIFEPVEANGAG
jgi:hypothetical protein